MKRIRFDHLLASTALGLVLMLSGAQAQVQKDQNVPIIVPIPDDLPPPTLETLGPAAVQAAPAEAAKPVAAAPA
ncbi:MAG: hypothetical protein ABI830_09555, partial [Pseudolabrys sp.]